MKRTVQTLRQAHIILRACFLLALPATAGSHAFARAISININTVTGSGTGWSFTSPTLTIEDDGVFIITGTATATANRIEVRSGKTANITLNNVNIDVSGINDVCAFDMTGATVNLTLEGSNMLKSGWSKAGLQAPVGSTLEITAAISGSLEASGGYNSAGIGGSDGSSTRDCGHITISGGTPHGLAVPPALNPAYTGMGTLTVCYTGTNGTGYPKSATAPVNAGDYDVTADVTEGALFAAAFDRPLGSYTIDPAEPTDAALDFDLTAVVYSGRPLPVAVTAGTDIAGLGAVTVKYNGLTRLPDEPGTYAVTVDIEPGANYTGIAGLLLGYFTVLESPQPGPIHRTVTLPSLADAVTRPAAGRHQTVSGQTFEFVLYPTSALAGYAPSVTVDRAAVNGETGVVCTPNADGSYTVRIRAVRQDLTVSITFPGASTGADAVEQAALIWSSGNRLYVSSPCGGQAIIYSLTGRAVRRFDAPPGVTVSQPLPPGVWIVVINGHRQKTVIQ